MAAKALSAALPARGWPTVGGGARPSNKELKLTKPGMIGASQLNSSVRRLIVGNSCSRPSNTRCSG